MNFKLSSLFLMSMIISIGILQAGRRIDGPMEGPIGNIAVAIDKVHELLFKNQHEQAKKLLSRILDSIEIEQRYTSQESLLFKHCETVARLSELLERAKELCKLVEPEKKHNPTVPDHGDAADHPASIAEAPWGSAGL